MAGQRGPVPKNVYDIKRRSGGYVVCRNDAEVSDVLASIEIAQTKLDKLERKDAQVNRPCICCEKTFTSHGVQNRMCSTCRTKSEGLI